MTNEEKFVYYTAAALTGLLIRDREGLPGDSAQALAISLTAQKYGAILADTSFKEALKFAVQVEQGFTPKH